MDPFEELRPLLFSMAYRMLGTRADAEDVLQEGFLRWQRAPVEQVRSAKSYLTATIARLSLDVLKEARRKRETYMGTWLPEPVSDVRAQDPVELAESLSIAFLHLLETLAPAERVAFLLREVFGEEYAEIARILETSEANVRQLVARSRKHLADRRPRFPVDRAQVEAMLARFTQACVSGDTDALTGMLMEDVVAYSDGGGKARAALNPIYGIDKVMRFVLGVSAKYLGTAEGRIANVNGEPAIVLSDQGSTLGVLWLDLADGKIRGIYYVANPDKLGSVN